MKKPLLSFALAFGAIAAARAQNMGVGTVTPDMSAMLDVTSSSRGVLLPRISLQSATDATTIAAPATGLIIYNTNGSLAAGTGFYFNSGTPAAPKWLRLAGVAGGTAPAVGQTIIWDGTNYVPGAPSITVSGAPLSGSGTPASPLAINTAAAVYNANNIQGKPVSTTAPTSGQVLQFNGTTYVPVTLSGDNWGTQSAAVTALTMSGNGTSGSPLNVKNGDAIWNANQINGKPVDFTTVPASGQTIVYDGSKFVPGNIVTGGLLSGNGTAASPILFNGVTTGTSSTSNTPLSGIGSAASPLNINTGLPVYNANNIQGKSVSNTAPANGQALVYNTSTSQYEPKTITGDNWGTQTVLTSGSGLSGTGVTGSPLTFTGVSVASGSPLSGDGTSGNQLSINTGAAVYNASKIQGKTVSATAPTTGQVLQFDGTNYTPATISGDNWGTQSAAVTALTMSGNGTSGSPLNVKNGDAIWNANQINGKAVDFTTAPANGQTLVYNSTSQKFVPGASGDNWGSQTVNLASGTPLSGGGTSGSPLTINTGSAVYNANKINGVAVGSGAPANGQALVYNTTTSQYEPKTISGDNWGTQTILTSGSGLSGTGVTGSPLTFTGISVASGSPLSGDGTGSNQLSINTGAAVYNASKIQGKTVSATAPTTGQVLQFDGTNYTPATISGDNWGTQSAAVTALTMSGNGTSGSPLNVKNGDAIWNAGTLQGKAISSTAPTTGQVLQYNGTSYVPATIAASAAGIDSTTASNGVKLVGNDVQLGGTLTGNVAIPLNSKTFTFTGTGKVGIGQASPANTLHVTATADPIRLDGLQQLSSTATTNYKPVVADENGVLKTAYSVNKLFGISTNGSQNLTTSTFNGGTPIKLTFAAADVDFNVGGIFSFNDANDEVTVNDSGLYVIEGWSGYVSNDDASNGSANNNITDNWGQGVNLNIQKNGGIISGTRYIYTADMAHTAVSSSLGVNFIATIYAKTVVKLSAGDKISLSLVKALGNDARDPYIMVPTGLTESKKLVITKM